MKRKVLICGGHVTPALALIDELKSDTTLSIVFIGRKYALEATRHVSAEFTLIAEKGIKFLPITTGRLQREFTVHTIPSLLKIPVGFIQALIYCLRERPDVIVSFGGYVALPVSVAGWLFGIPVITHEQTLSGGLTTQIVGHIAKRICVTFEESITQFPEDKVVFTGLPIRRDIFSSNKKPYTIDEKRFPVIYVTGGSTGAKTLNDRIFPVVKRLLTDHTVIHQTGELSLPNARATQDSLAVSLRSRYIIEPYIAVGKLAWILKNAEIVISRSGANTTIELAASGSVAILVPLPWSAADEQLLHARWLAHHGGAEVMLQNAMTSESLLDKIADIRKNYKSLHLRAMNFSKHVPRDGAKRLAKEVLSLLPTVV